MTKLLFLIIILFSQSYTQNYQPGKSYFGKNNYTEYFPGSLPIIISAPHGGYLNPLNIPDRTCNNPTTVRDSYTQELAREIDTACVLVFNCHPHLIFNLLDRKKLDANREINEATCGNQDATDAWNDFHNFITIAKNKIEKDYQKGFYIDLHGHGHPILRLELGYLFSKSELAFSDSIFNLQNYINRSSMRNLILNNKNNFKHSDLLRGEFSFGTIITSNGINAVPSSSIPFPLANEDYFSGGYNTAIHGSQQKGNIDGLQIESHYSGARDTQQNRKKYAMALVLTLKTFLLKHYFNESDLNKCTSTNILNRNDNKIGVNDSIYPNPNSGVFTIILKQKKREKTNISIFNLLGQEILRKTFNSFQSTVTLPNNIKPGIYFMLIENGGEIKSQKLIVSFDKH